MRNFILTISSILFLQIAFGQDVKTLEKPEKASSAADRVVIELAHANWLNKGDSLQVKWYSRAINLYFTYDFALNEGKNFSFSPGIGIGTNVVTHNSFFDVDDENVTVFTEAPDSVDFNRNNLHTPYLDVPLEFRFRTNPDRFGRRWKAAVGLKGGYSFQAHTKYIGQNPELASVNEIKFKEYRIQNLNNFWVGYTLRFGYGNFNIIGFVSQTTLFNKDRGPGMRPFNIGISFNSL